MLLSCKCRSDFFSFPLASFAYGSQFRSSYREEDCCRGAIEVIGRKDKYRVKYKIAVVDMSNIGRTQTRRLTCFVHVRQSVS
jgi:hypothetical protein